MRGGEAVGYEDLHHLAVCVVRNAFPDRAMTVDDLPDAQLFKNFLDDWKSAQPFADFCPFKIPRRVGHNRNGFKGAPAVPFAYIDLWPVNLGIIRSAECQTSAVAAPRSGSHSNMFISVLLVDFSMMMGSNRNAFKV